MAKWIGLLVGTIVLQFPPLLKAAEEYHLAVVPQHSPTAIHRTWKPFADYLSEATGTQIVIDVFRTFDEFESALVNGVADLAYMNPYHQIMARKAQGYLPLVRDESKKLAGVLVVPVNSPIQSVRELNGKTIGFPDPNAFAASLYLRALLREQEKINFNARYLTTHGNVYRHVIVGTVDAGGGVNRTLERDRAETRAALRVLYRTPGTASHPLSAHPRLPAAYRESLIQAILALSGTEKGRKLLKDVQLDKPVRANYADDYQALSKLNIDRHAIAIRLPAP